MTQYFQANIKRQQDFVDGMNISSPLRPTEYLRGDACLIVLTFCLLFILFCNGECDERKKHTESRTKHRVRASWTRPKYRAAWEKNLGSACCLKKSIILQSILHRRMRSQKRGMGMIIIYAQARSSKKLLKNITKQPRGSQSCG